MSSWLILLLLLFGNQNSRNNDNDFGCGCGSNGSNRAQQRNFPGGRDWNSDDDDDDSGCDGDNNRGRSLEFNGTNDFERNWGRNDSRSFDNSDCGCNNQ